MYIPIWIIVIGIVLYLIYNSKNKNQPLSSEAFKSPSYKLDLILEPNWSQILEKLAGDNNTDVEKFYTEIKDDKNLDVDDNESLYGHIFRFVCFYDGVSHLQPVWSDYHKTFVDGAEIRGKIFEYKNKVLKAGEKLDLAIGSKKFKYKNIGNTLVINPTFIGFHTILPDGDVLDDDKLSVFPFNEIIQFFIDMQKNLELWGSMYKIKKFSPNLALILEKDKIQYLDWNYEDYGCGVESKEDLIESEWAKKNGIEICDQNIREQIFSAPFFTIRIKMEFFE